MKHCLRKKIIAMSKFFFYVGCLQALFATMTIASTGQAQALEKTYITSVWKNISLESAFTDIQKQSDFHFTYNYELIKNISVSNQNEEVKLAELLKYFTSQTGLKFLVKNEIIYVAPDEQQTQKKTLKKMHLYVPDIDQLRKDESFQRIKAIYEVTSVSFLEDKIIKGKVKSEAGEPLVGSNRSRKRKWKRNGY